MALTITSVPTVPVAGQDVRLIGTSTTATDDATQWAVTSVPAKSKLSLGQLVQRPGVVARTDSVLLTYVPQVTVSGKPAAITRTSGSFADDGYKVGMVLDISGTASNNKRVTIAALDARRLTLGPKNTLTAETVTSSLRAVLVGSSPPSDTFTPDVPGEYDVTGYEYLEIPAAGRYDGDPLSVAQLRLVGTATSTIYVGTPLDLPIVPVSGHSSTLRIIVVGDTVRAAALVNPATELARMAALDATVAAAMAALVGVAVNSLEAADFVSSVNGACAVFEAHRVLVGIPPVHASADNTNAMLRETANSVPAAIERLNDWASKMLEHMQATSAGGTWHNADDGKNTLQVAPSARTLSEATVLLADMRERVYRRHIAQTASPASHSSADAANTLTAAASGSLSYVIMQYLDFVASNTPSIPASESEGVGDAQAAWGFRAS